MELAPGTLVTDKVRLVEPLGQGSMGVVWVADHLTLKTRVAVKFLSARLSQEDPIALARFEREACASAQVKSPHVVQTFDHGIHESGRPYIVMELLEGQNLVERLHARGALPPEDVRRMVEHIGHALSAAHKIGIIHRDVKPGNVFFMEQGNSFFCKLLDFGVAKPARVAQIAGITESGSLLGTPEFMSPEQLMRPQAVDGTADFWALAATAYSALTDYVPFEATTLGELCVKILNSEYEPPSHRRELPAAVDRWFERAFHRLPEHRFADAELFTTSFGLAIAGQDPTSVPPPQLDNVPMSSTPAARRRAHEDAATLSGSSSDAQLRRPPRRAGRWAALVLISALSAVIAYLVFREAPRAPSPAASEHHAAPAPPPAAPPSSSSVVAPVAAPQPSVAPVATGTTAQPPHQAQRIPFRLPLPSASSKNQHAAPGDPGF